MALPTFEELELLLHTKLNALSADIEARLAALTGANLAWPVTAEGNLDMDDQWTIVQMRNLWNVVNIGEYDTYQDALDDVSTGGFVLVPPNTTISTSGLTIGASNVWIVGCGMSSVLQCATDATDPLIKVDPGLSNIGVFNMKMEGSAALSSKGVLVQRCDGFRMAHVRMSGFKNHFIHVTHSGTTSNNSTDVQLHSLHLEGGTTAKHIVADSVDGLHLTDIVSDTPGANGIDIAAAAVDAPIKNVCMSNVRVKSPTGKGIVVDGFQAAADLLWSNITLTGCLVDTPTDTGIEIGTSLKKVRDINLSGCLVTGVSGAPASGSAWIIVNGYQGLVTGCVAQGGAASSVGLDLVASEHITVQGGSFRDNATGIDANTATDITIQHPDLTGCTLGVDLTGVGTPPVSVCAAQGALAKTPGAVGFKTLAQAADTDATVYTVLANTLSKPGDGLVISLSGLASGGSGSIALKVGGNNIGGVDTANGTDAVVLIRLFVNSAGIDQASNTVYAVLGTNGNGAASATEGVLTIDWTTDIAINVVTGPFTQALSLSVQALDGVILS